MENASKALLIAGGMLFTVLIVTLFMFFMASIREHYEGVEEQKRQEELTEFNISYINYARDGVLGYELLSLINKVIDYNQLESVEGYNSGSVVGNRSQASPITLEIVLWGKDGAPDRDSVLNLFATSIKCPKKLSSIAGTADTIAVDLRLFDKNKNSYTQSTVQNTLGDIIGEVTGIESTYGGKNGAQKLATNISSIYEGKIIGYNDDEGRGVDSSWYEASFIINKYKTLTGDYPDGTDEHDRIDDIRDEDNLINIAKYYEYMQFQRAEFNCTEINYNDQTGRISKLKFVFTGNVE